MSTDQIKLATETKLRWLVLQNFKIRQRNQMDADWINNIDNWLKTYGREASSWSMITQIDRLYQKYREIL